MPEHKRNPTHRADASARAREITRYPFVVFDTETTGLESGWDRIVQFAAVDCAGNVLVNTLINPGEPIHPDATEIHGITDDRVATAPTFAEAYSEIRRAIQCKRWAVYNLEFDRAFLEHECARNLLPIPTPVTRWDEEETYCAMLTYAEWWGSWHDYFGNYRWQQLQVAKERHAIDTPGSAHDALSDCYATLELINIMARSH